MSSPFAECAAIPEYTHFRTSREPEILFLRMLKEVEEERRKGEELMRPKKGEPGYAEYRQAYNERRRKRFQDPEYEQREKSLIKQRRQRRKAEQISSRQKKATTDHDKES